MVALITPPVCTTAFIGAGIAGASPMGTGWQATRLGIATYLIPFSFAISPALLLIGTPAEVVLGTITAIIGVASLAVAAAGYLYTKVSWGQRALFFIAAVTLIMPGKILAMIGIVCLAIAVVWHLLSLKKLKHNEFG
jgi:TRAP-type uncharacterized transport system fused permease subunit